MGKPAKFPEIRDLELPKASLCSFPKVPDEDLSNHNTSQAWRTQLKGKLLGANLLSLAVTSPQVIGHSESAFPKPIFDFRTQKRSISYPASDFSEQNASILSKKPVFELMTDLENQYYKEIEEFESEKNVRNQISIISDTQNGLRELFKNQTDSGLEKKNSYDYAQNKTFHLML